LVVAASTIQSRPKFVEIQIPPGSTAACLAPLLDAATPLQARFVGAPLKIQEPPESDDVQIPPLSATAVILRPFLEQAMNAQLLLGASLRFQFIPEFVE
jgi:hypothetical protein